MELKDSLLDAALPHVPFDGWGETTFQAAITDCGADPVLARAACPRGAVDLALHYHKRGDALMLERLKQTDLSGLRFRDKIAAAVRFRLEAVEDKELVRRGTTLFALPLYAADGAKAIWGTVDAIWTALGDSSDDVNWYTKRMTLSGVYSATVLFWMGDTSENNADSWAFLDRRVDDVMQIEKIKAKIRENPVLSRLSAGPNWILNHIKAPATDGHHDLPGQWGRPQE